MGDTKRSQADRVSYLDRMFGADGRTALVTGSTRGLGRVFADALSRAGATVMINGRDARVAADVAAAIRADGRDAHPVAFDVTDQRAATEAIRVAETDVGPIDILINNAGINRRGPVESLSIEDWNAVVTTNMTAAFVVGQAVAIGMLARGSGAIVNVGSLLGLHARPTTSAYAAAKAGIMMLTRAMATEWGARGVRVNGLVPGYFATEMNLPLKNDPTFNGWIEGRTPMRRWGEPEELCGAILYLCSPAASFTTGQMIAVDGGVLATI